MLCRQPRAVTGKTNLLPTSQSPKPIAALGLLRRTLFSGSIPLILGNKKASRKASILKDSYIILQKRSKSLNDSCSFCCLNKLITFSYSILHSEFSSSQTVSNMAISISFIDESVYSDFLLNFSLSHKKTLCLVFASIRERM